MKKKFYKSITIAAMCVAFTACEKNEELITTPLPMLQLGDGAYILNAGNNNSNNGSLSFYDFKTKKVLNDICLQQNPNDTTVIGDWANHMCVYGSKIYIAVTGSAKIEVFDLNAKRLKTIKITNKQGQAAKPRFVTSHDGNVYVSVYGGSVNRIDTVTLNINGKVKVGDFPEAMTVADNKLFVNNSKYGKENITDKGNTVSVINLQTFQEERKIEVVLNPYEQILTASDGYVYVVSSGNWDDILGTLQRIDPKTYQVTELGRASLIASHDNRLYVTYSVYGSDENWLKTYDLETDQYSKEEFIPAKQFSYISALSVNPTTGDVYIGDSPYGAKGDLYIYNKDGDQITSFEVGYSPRGAFFAAQKK